MLFLKHTTHFRDLCIAIEPPQNQQVINFQYV
uniref:Uncharacterized protein n=1 Tax=Anguilla anguilla TaxID=7936 RepID=A0A0E9R9D5_ANGAN